ncbi:putative glutamate--cysteine ligase [Helianthus debilis subsp. tardiflorus]
MRYDNVFKVPVTGLKTPFRDGLLKHVAEEVLQFAKDGLERRGYKETGFLNEVAEVVRTGELCFLFLVFSVLTIINK